MFYETPHEGFLELEHIPCHGGIQAQEQVLLCRRPPASHQISCSENCHFHSSEKKVHVYLDNVMEEVSARNKLHDKEESLLALEGSIEGGEEPAVVAKSQDLSLKEGDGDAVLAQDVLLAQRLDRTQLHV